jgi:hypothetical protein
MLAFIGSQMGFNTYTRYKVTPDHKRELDVAWLQGRNAEVAIEVQFGGSIVDAIDRLTEARNFSYRKLIIVIRESQLSELEDHLKFKGDLKPWVHAWSIQSVYEMYKSGQSFLHLYEKLIEAKYRRELEFVRE